MKISIIYEKINNFFFFSLVFMLVAVSVQAQKPPNPKHWYKVYTEEGRSLWIPKGWLSEEKVLSDSTIQFLSYNKAKQLFLTMYFFKTDRSAGERMQAMVSANNIDVKKSYTETFGSLQVMSRLGKMNRNGVSNNVLVSTSDGAGGKWNVVGAFWGDQERFGKHKFKFPIFFNSLD